MCPQDQQVLQGNVRLINGSLDRQADALRFEQQVLIFLIRFSLLYRLSSTASLDGTLETTLNFSSEELWQTERKTIEQEKVYGMGGNREEFLSDDKKLACNQI